MSNELKRDLEVGSSASNGLEIPANALPSFLGQTSALGRTFTLYCSMMLSLVILGPVYVFATQSLFANGDLKNPYFLLGWYPYFIGTWYLIARRFNVQTRVLFATVAFSFAFVPQAYLVNSVFHDDIRQHLSEDLSLRLAPRVRAFRAEHHVLPDSVDEIMPWWFRWESCMDVALSIERGRIGYYRLCDSVDCFRGLDVDTLQWDEYLPPGA